MRQQIREVAQAAELETAFFPFYLGRIILFVASMDVMLDRMFCDMPSWLYADITEVVNNGARLGLSCQQPLNVSLFMHYVLCSELVYDLYIFNTEVGRKGMRNKMWYWYYLCFSLL